MEWLFQDFAYGVRFLRKRLGLTAIAVLVLGLGISLTASMYAIIDGVILTGPDYEAVDEIVHLETTIPQSQFNQAVRLHDYLDWREQQTVFQEMSAHFGFSANLSGEDGPAQRYSGVRLTASTFDLVGVRPLLGRVFTAEDDFVTDQQLVVLGHHVWEQRYASDPAIIGRTIRVNAAPATVIGVMPPDFRFPELHDLWMPIGENPSALGRRDGPGLAVLGRMGDGVSIAEVQTQLTTIANRLALEYPNENEEVLPVVESWVEAQFVDEETRGLLYTMFTAVVGVLLIACANVANLLLATTIARGKELALRSALGAARNRVLRQLLSETLVLAAGGAIVGLVLSKFSLDYFTTVIAPLAPPPWMVFEVSPAVFAFVLGVTFFTALVSGMLPAYQATKVDLHRVLNDQARGSSSRSVGKWSTALVVVEVALSCALLVGAGLMIRSTLKVGADDYGLDRTNIMTAGIGLPSATYEDSTSRKQFTENLYRELQALPGARAVAVSSSLPVLGTSFRFYAVRDREYTDDSEYSFSGYTRVTPGFFDLIGVPIVAGRDFRESDALGTERVAIVDQRFADLNWPNQDPLGKEVRLGRSDSENPWSTVIGVVQTFEMIQPLQFGSSSPEGMFVPVLQQPSQGLSIMLKADGAAAGLAAPVRDLIARLDRDIPVTNLNTLESRVDDVTIQFTIISGMFVTFGLVALVLASIGLYAVMAFSVNRRTAEVGIRMALGANGGKIIGLIFRQGALPVCIGMTVGLALALLLGNALSTFLFNVSVIDPVTFVGIPLLLIGVSVAALLVPANRAARVTPVVALRAE